jgi:prepilin-type N-terminal cleavage/methylation domain-containing protein
MRLAALGRVMGRSTERGGFTIIEMMIALVIIGAMAVAAAPAFSVTLADNRQRAAAVYLLRLANKARSLALASGLAHLLRLQGTTTQLGTAMLYGGMNGHCSQTPWGTAFQVLDGHGPIESFDMAAYNPTGAGYAISARPSHGDTLLDELWICYQPNGETWSRVLPSTDAVIRRQLASYQVTVSRRIGSAKSGPDRTLRFSPGASPWIL